MRASLLLIIPYLAFATAAATLPSFYAPVRGSCPSAPLVRAANGLSSAETAYINARKVKASAALASWLKKTNAGFPTDNLPTLGLSTSGGGLRSLLSGAGVVQGLDSRDSNTGTSGVFQGLTYQSGLSGGAWFLSSLAGNNFPTVTSLKTSLWEEAFENSLFLRDKFLAAAAYPLISNDIAAKDKAGFPPTLTDPYGRLLSYQLLKGFDGGVQSRLSKIASGSQFSGFLVPYPIITAVGVQETRGECIPPANAAQWEFHPYETGSWDDNIKAFTISAYLGTSLKNGQPTTAGSCVMNYDNLGYVLGTSSNLFNEACVVTQALNSSTDLSEVLAALVTRVHDLTLRDEFAVYPNPFFQRPESSAVASQQSVYLVDGGESGQNNPIWPFIQPARAVDVLIVNDNSADSESNWPDGSQIFNTYQQAQARGLSRMPFIPPSLTFVSQGLNKRPTFFGCDNPNALTIIYLPNAQYTFPSNEPTFKLQYSKADTDAMIANGVQIASKGGDAAWPTCLGCAITKKSGKSLPAECNACFSQYCYKQ